MNVQIRFLNGELSALSVNFENISQNAKKTAMTEAGIGKNSVENHVFSGLFPGQSCNFPSYFFAFCREIRYNKARIMPGVHAGQIQ
ncbi:MAG TPA: hypothetical protein IAA04_03950 [Candidatus Lachnoclostridium pullistercoris]|uniref:Uncharacterized protein n=1 Tax=Candidatus Lachnoclostridium pullistercoris TaxID=2838632 RepID=A0A9D2T5E7_9FIRM|nr:hypothetical protein [Candidatus Lachnoclostridium pullistercoris]